MALTENSIVISKTGDLLCVFYNGGSRTSEKHTRNTVTREYVDLLIGGSGVTTNLLDDDDNTYTYNMFDTINGVDITNNQILFNELEKEL